MNYFASNNGGTLLEVDPPIEEIYDLLYQLGIIANCSGFFYVTFSVWLAVREPERLTLVTKWLYRDVAKHYGTNWGAVESGIRRVIAEVWATNPDLLSEWAGYELTSRPRPAHFISILASRIATSKTDQS